MVSNIVSIMRLSHTQCLNFKFSVHWIVLVKWPRFNPAWLAFLSQYSTRRKKNKTERQNCTYYHLYNFLKLQNITVFTQILRMKMRRTFMWEEKVATGAQKWASLKEITSGPSRRECLCSLQVQQFTNVTALNKAISFSLLLWKISVYTGRETTSKAKISNHFHAAQWFPIWQCYR